MTALIVVDLTLINKDKLALYSAQAAETLISYEGEFIAKGPITSLHGGNDFSTKVIIQFPSKEHATDWYNSSEYQAIIPLREQAFSSQFHLISS